MIQTIEKISNIQLELLKVYSTGIPDEELIDLKDILATYFLDKAQKEIKIFSIENQINPETLNHWASEHNRI